MNRRLLVVDADPQVTEAVRRVFQGKELQVEGVLSGEEALGRMSRWLPDVVLVDVRLPGLTGLEVCRVLNERGVDVPVLVMSSHANMELAIQAMQEGAYDYLAKPFQPEGLVRLVEQALESRAVARSDDVPVPRSSAVPPDAWQLVGRSDPMLEVYKTIGRVAPTDSTVLITGESGTGKEVVARLIHEKGPSAGEPFEAVNCTAIPETLLEGELFGYEKGAFTGATRERTGKFELAGRGTLFLDEVGELPQSLQVKLLRALEEREVDRLGGARKVPVEARIVAATNRDLAADVHAGRFREDLFFRLAVVTLHVPPLRERPGDVRLLADHFMAHLAPQVGRRLERVSVETYRRLEAHSWPGNVRELRNVVERSLIMGAGPLLRPQDLPPLEDGNHGPRDGTMDLRELIRTGAPLDEVERRYIELVLQDAGGNATRAAQRLGIHRSTLQRKLRRAEAPGS